MFLIVFILVTITIDTSVVKISSFIGTFYYFQNFYNVLFIGTAASFAFIQFFILRVLMHRYVEPVMHEKLKLQTLRKVVVFANYGMIAILVAIILEMSLVSSYHIGFVYAIIWITYGLTLTILSFLSFMFLRWFKRIRSHLILAYAAAIMMLSINVVITIIFMTIELGGFGSMISPSASPILLGNRFVGGLDTSSIFLNNLYNITNVISFILTWSATVIFLRYYTKIIGRVKYWVLASIPLVYFLASFQTFVVDIFHPFRLANPLLFGVIYALTFSAVKPAGATLFGIAFWVLERKVTDRGIKNNLIVCSYGIIILFAANQPVGLLLTPYPPFSLATISFMAVASFLILIGISLAAITVSFDSSLRQSIRKIAMDESQLLDKIGIAEYEREIEKRVITVTEKARDLLENESGISSSLSDEQIKNYITEIAEEINSKKSQRS
jgi:hypothetical protein